MVDRSRAKYGSSASHIAFQRKRKKEAAKKKRQIKKIKGNSMASGEDGSAVQEEEFSDTVDIDDSCSGEAEECIQLD